MEAEGILAFWYILVDSSGLIHSGAMAAVLNGKDLFSQLLIPDSIAEIK